MGPFAWAHLRQELPARVRGCARPRRQAARRRVQTAQRGPQRLRDAADLAAHAARPRAAQAHGAGRDARCGGRGGRAPGHRRADPHRAQRQRQHRQRRSRPGDDRGQEARGPQEEGEAQAGRAQAGPADAGGHGPPLRLPAGGREGARPGPHADGGPADRPLQGQALRDDLRQLERDDAGQRQAAHRAPVVGRDRLRGRPQGPPRAVRAAADLRGLMTVGARAGIVVTGTEVLTGQILDRNGGWISERLRELGVEHSYTLVVADRRDDMRDALEFMAARGMDLVVTSGGLGPTADDLTAEVVGDFQGREMVLDEPTEERIAEILRPLAARFPNLDMEAVREANRKQAVVPRGSTILPPVGTAPGLVVAPSEAEPTHPTVLVLPGPPRELQAMWPTAIATDAFRAAIAGAR